MHGSLILACCVLAQYLLLKCNFSFVDGEDAISFCISTLTLVGMLAAVIYMVRPDIIDVLFLRSFTEPFQRVLKKVWKNRPKITSKC